MNMEKVFEQAIGSAVYSVVKTLIEQGGLSVGSAMRLTSFIVLESTLGEGVSRDLGLHERAERAWRAEVREAMEGVEVGDEEQARLLRGLADLMARRPTYVPPEEVEQDEG